MRSRFQVVAISALLASLLTASCDTGSTTVGDSATRAEVVRDRWGVPHIFGDTELAAYYGLGWAAAEDRFEQMSWTKLALSGRLSSVLATTPGFDSVEAFDQQMRLAGWMRKARTQAFALAQFDPQARARLDAFADGVNDQVRNNLDQYAGALFPIETWTAADSIAAWMQLGIFLLGNLDSEIRRLHEIEALRAMGLSDEEILDELVGSLVIDEAAAVVQQEDVPDSVQQAMAEYAAGLGLGSRASGPGAWSHAETRFSQAWAVSGARTASGETLVVSDPRLPLFVPSVLWEAQLSYPGVTARGATVPGSTNFLVGSTRQVAWGASALTLDQADLYRVITDPLEHPGQYLLDGEWVDFEVDSQETISVAGGTDLVLPYRETIWGPLVTRFPGDNALYPNVAAGEEYALAFAPCAALEGPNPELPERAFHRLYQASDATEFADLLSQWSTPPVQCVFADRNGGVGTWSVGTLAVRNPANLLGGTAAQDGSTTSSAWLDLVPHALKPGSLQPQGGYVGSANNLPIGSWYPIPLVRSGGHTPRSRRLTEGLALALPNDTVLGDPDSLVDLRSDAVWTAGRDLALLGIAVRDGALEVDGAFELSEQARTATGFLDDWVDRGNDGALLIDELVDGTLDNTRLQASALASVLGTRPFRSVDFGGEVPTELIDRFGTGEAGQAFLLRSMRTKLADSTALSAVEAEFLDTSLAGALEDTLDAAGDASLWAGWYEANVLSATLPTEASLLLLQAGLPPLGTFGVAVGPVRAGAPETLAGQLEAVHSQVVRFPSLGPATIRTLSPLGQAGLPGDSHATDQEDEWLADPQGLKAQPLDRSALAAESGPLTTTVLIVGQGAIE